MLPGNAPKPPGLPAGPFPETHAVGASFAPAETGVPDERLALEDGLRARLHDLGGAAEWAPPAHPRGVLPRAAEYCARLLLVGHLLGQLVIENKFQTAETANTGEDHLPV